MAAKTLDSTNIFTPTGLPSSIPYSLSLSNSSIPSSATSPYIFSANHRAPCLSTSIYKSLHRRRKRRKNQVVDKICKDNEALNSCTREGSNVSCSLSSEKNEWNSILSKSSTCIDDDSSASDKNEEKTIVKKKMTLLSLPDFILGDSDLENSEIHKDLPKELLAQFSILRCELCMVQMNSILQSKMHYGGKQHQKKIRLFMDNWYEKRGEPNPKKMRRESSLAPPLIPDDKRLYCECCDLSFTSVLHAQQHYDGRNHQRVANGQQPLRSGYFNRTTRRWQRHPPTGVTPTSVLQGLGPFIPPVLLSPEILPLEKKNEKTERNEDSKKGRFFCDLCNIGATSQEQLDMHIKGVKHLKAERAYARSDNYSNYNKDVDLSKEPPSDSILASVTQTKKKWKGKDYSIYRTPTGRYYCQPCDLTATSESQFIQHLSSKGHKSVHMKEVNRSAEECEDAPSSSSCLIGGLNSSPSDYKRGHSSFMKP